MSSYKNDICGWILFKLRGSSKLPPPFLFPKAFFSAADVTWASYTVEKAGSVSI